MRRSILAVAALCPLMVHAQANTSVQPQSAASGTVLESRLSAPATPGVSAAAPATAAEGVKGATPVATPLRVSTGVTYAKLLESSPVAESSKWQWRATEREKLAVVKLVVEADGTPSHIEVLKTLGGTMDADLVQSVSHYRFVPGKLNDKPTPVEMTLTVAIEGHATGAYGR